MNSANSAIISHKLLSQNEISFCKEILLNIPIQGAFLGAIRSGEEHVNPVILSSNELIYIKLAKIAEQEDQVLVNYLDATNKQIRKQRISNQELQCGSIGDFFWQSRSFDPMTLAHYCNVHQLTTEQANQFLLKILNQLLELRRLNITHGHISPDNIVLEAEEIKFVDYNFCFCLNKGRDSKFLPSEFNIVLTPDFQSDVFCFGKLIKYLYKGLQCPLPLDLPDRMCSPKPAERPDIIEINNTITNTFTKKRSKTEMWSASRIPASEIDPAVRFNKYLTPDLIALIRKEHTEHQKTVEETSRRFFTQAHLFLTFFTAILLWAAYLAYPYLNQTELQSQPIVTPKKEIADTPALRFAKNIFRKEKIENDEELVGTIKIASKDLQNFEFVSKYFQRSDSLEVQLIKLRALLPIYGSNMSALDALYPELKKNSVLSKYLDWFRGNKLAEWEKVADSTKLLILGASAPKGILELKLYLDLARHFDPEIAQTGVKGTQELISNKFDAAFYQQLIVESSSFARSDVTFLLFALKEEGSTSSALISRWFKTAQPAPEVLLRLVLKKDKKPKQEDYFSFYVAQYLKDKKINLTTEQLRLLSNHHEAQLRMLKG